MERLDELRNNNPDANLGITKFSDRTKEEMRASKIYCIQKTVTKKNLNQHL